MQRRSRQGLFEGTGTCTSCHRVNGRVSRLGPEPEQHRSASPRSGARDFHPSNPTRKSCHPIASIASSHARVRRPRAAAEPRYIFGAVDRREGTAQIVCKVQICAIKAFVEKTSMPSYQGKLNPQETADGSALGVAEEQEQPMNAEQPSVVRHRAALPCWFLRRTLPSRRRCLRAPPHAAQERRTGSAIRTLFNGATADSRRLRGQCKGPGAPGFGKPARWRNSKRRRSSWTVCFTRSSSE